MHPAGIRCVAAAVGVVALAGCAGDGEVRTIGQAETVESHVPGGCSTAVVIELSRQIAQEVDCLMPGQLVPLPDDDTFIFTGAAVLPYVSEEARADLVAAAASGTIEINSAYRTVVQQYLLYRWYQAGRCGITAAARPGTSNHESGRAIDVANWPERRAALTAHGWAQTVPGDEVHFDHLASPDIRGSDVLAFQRLWNRNHPDDPIDEDGFYGPQTEARIAAAPAEGFAIGAWCVGSPDEPPDGDDGDDVDDPGAVRPAAVVGGCAAGGGGGLGVAVLVLLIGVRGRRS
jgi:hypothetical protein